MFFDYYLSWDNVKYSKFILSYEYTDPCEIDLMEIFFYNIQSVSHEIYIIC